MATIQLDDDLLKVMELADVPIDRLVRELLVMEMYRRGTIPRGKAAELLGMPLADFLHFASDLGNPPMDVGIESSATETPTADAFLASQQPRP